MPAWHVVLFLLVCLGAVASPRAWMRLSFLLLLSHFDMSWPGTSSSQVGLLNAVRSLLVPALVCVRGLMSIPSTATLWTYLRSATGVALWGLWLLVALVGMFHSPYPLDGGKMVAALLSHGLFFLAFVTNTPWEMRPLHLSLVVMGAAVLALEHTFLFEAPFANAPRYLRVSSFSSPQSFSQGIALLSFWGLWRSRGRIGYEAFFLIAGLFLIALSGSRSGALGWAAGVAIWLVFRRSLAYWATVALLLVAMVGGLALLPQARSAVLSSRIGELARVADDSNESSIRTLTWRQSLYRCYVDDLRHRRGTLLLLGSGTASIGRSAEACMSERYVTGHFSPNRVAHNELIRAFYDWGLIGLALMISMLALLIHRVIFKLPDLAHHPYWGPLTCALPLLLLVLVIENISQAAAAPGVVGFTALLAVAVHGEAGE